MALERKGSLQDEVHEAREKEEEEEEEEEKEHRGGQRREENGGRARGVSVAR